MIFPSKAASVRQSQNSSVAIWMPYLLPFSVAGLNVGAAANYPITQATPRCSLRVVRPAAVYP